MDIRIQASEDKRQEVLDALRPLGVEIMTGVEEPLVTALFYLSRINTKLDNLGQLGHLNKVQRYVAESENHLKTIGDYYADLANERRLQQQHALNYYLRLRELYRPEQVNTIIPTYVRYLEHYDILRLFKPYLTEEQYTTEFNKL